MPSDRITPRAIRQISSMASGRPRGGGDRGQGERRQRQRRRRLLGQAADADAREQPAERGPGGEHRERDRKRRAAGEQEGVAERGRMGGGDQAEGSKSDRSMR